MYMILELQPEHDPKNNGSFLFEQELVIKTPTQYAELKWVDVRLRVVMNMTSDIIVYVLHVFVL